MLIVPHLNACGVDKLCTYFNLLTVVRVMTKNLTHLSLRYRDNQPSFKHEFDGIFVLLFHLPLMVCSV